MKDTILSVLRLIATPVLLMVLGLILLIHPDSASALVAQILGWVLVIAGVVFAVSAVAGHFDTLGKVLSAVCCFAVGAWLLRNPLMLAAGLGRLAGILLVVRGIQDILNAGRYHYGILPAVITTVLGAVLIALPMTTSRVVISLCGLLVLIVGMQIGYGVMRRLNTANLSESVSVDTVSTALKGGLEWGNGFTQFPLDFTVDEADERTGTVEVTVLDTSSANELELLSNGQIQAAALATNALLNDKIDRVVYNVHAYIDEDSNIQHDSFFGMFPARGHQSAILTFVWTKSSSNATSIDWKMRIVSMDDTIAERIQKQVNSVSSLIEDPVVSQTKIDEEKAERDLEHRLHGREIFRGGKPDRTPSELLDQDKK